LIKKFKINNSPFTKRLIICIIISHIDAPFGVERLNISHASFPKNNQASKQSINNVLDAYQYNSIEILE
jgi:hypothetical protein